MSCHNPCKECAKGLGTTVQEHRPKQAGLAPTRHQTDDAFQLPPRVATLASCRLYLQAKVEKSSKGEGEGYNKQQD